MDRIIDLMIASPLLVIIAFASPYPFLPIAIHSMATWCIAGACLSIGNSIRKAVKVQLTDSIVVIPYGGF